MIKRKNCFYWKANYNNIATVYIQKFPLFFIIERERE